MSATTHDRDEGELTVEEKRLRISDAVDGNYNRRRTEPATNTRAAIQLGRGTLEPLAATVSGYDEIDLRYWPIPRLRAVIREACGLESGPDYRFNADELDAIRKVVA